MSLTRPLQLAHVVYRTRRFEQMVHWYQTVFGARVISENPVMAFLTFDDEHHRFAMINLDAVRPDAVEPDRRGLLGVDHVAYSYQSLTDLLQNYGELKAAGIEPYWCVHHGLTVSMYYADPDGNQMEFQVDAYPTAEELQDYISGPKFAVNPIGVEYDPAEWLARLRAGTPVSGLLVRESDVPVSPLRGLITA